MKINLFKWWPCPSRELNAYTHFTPPARRLGETKTDYISRTQAAHLVYFEIWAKDRKWEWFAPQHSHFDWWMFPIKNSSSGYGDTFAINAEEIERLKTDPQFMKNYRRGVELVLLSWGWELYHECEVPNGEKTADQLWSGYGVRLGKMADSLYLFNEKKLYESVQKFFILIQNQYPLEQWVIENCSRKFPEQS